MQCSLELFKSIRMSDVSRKKFGGGWSGEKLDALRSYLTSYIQALSQTSFERVYIDAFAGAGTREVTQNTEEELFDESLLEEDASYRHGSPLIALGIEPSFQRYIELVPYPANPCWI